MSNDNSHLKSEYELLTERCNALTSQLSTALERVKELEHPRIYTRCPACGNDTLTINHDKHLLCTWIECPNPTLIHESKSRITALETEKSKWISDAAWNKGLVDAVNTAISALETENGKLRENIYRLEKWQNERIVQLEADLADHELLHGKEWVTAVRAVNGDVEAAKVQMIAKYVGELAVAKEALDIAEKVLGGRMFLKYTHPHLHDPQVEMALAKIAEAKKGT